MLMLWFFGSAIEGAWGRRQFLFYYFFTGIGAALCTILFSFKSLVPVVGASGAIFGILVAYAMMYPEDIILLFFLFPMKMKYAVLLLAGINLLGAVSSPHGGVAYFAHLGGGLFGYLYLKNERVRRYIIYHFNPANLRLWWVRSKMRRQQLRQQDFEQAVDRILDKISRSGMQSLTRKEREILQRRSKEV